MAQKFTPATPDFAAIVHRGFARQSLMTFYGARLMEVSPGRVVIELAPNAQLLQQAGSVHGGVIGALADSAGGFAALTLAPAGSDVVTIEYKINFLRAATGTVRATGEVIRPGKTITVARIVCEAGAVGAVDTCAVVQATFMRVAERPITS